MCSISQNKSFTLLDSSFDNELYFKELESMKKNKEKLIKTLNKGEKKLCEIFKK